MANIFNSVKIKLQRKNKFNLSFPTRLTTEFGRLTPFLCEEVLPNDTFKINTAIRCQFAPMKFPVMQRFTAYLHYFFVARRLLMDDWENFITCGEDGITEIPYPTVAFDSTLWNYLDDKDDAVRLIFGDSHLADYLGFPTVPDNDVISIQTNIEDCHQVDIMPFRAYHRICNEWYNDETLSEEVDIHSDVNGIQNLVLQPKDIVPLFGLRQRAWKKDYFTSALPDPQRGPDVTLPIVTNGEIVGTGDYTVILDKVYPKSGGQIKDIEAGKYEDGNLNLVYPDEQLSDGSKMALMGDQNADNVASKLRLNEDGLRSATINEVRRAFAIQRWYELAARAGNRYIEQILAHFGIRSSDARLQRTEYIGGAAIPVNVGDILQTSESGDTPLGTPAGIAQAMGRAGLKKGKFTAEEHGYIIGILSIIPDASYPQGMPRKFLRRKTFDFAWPLLANIGEQEIKRGELFYDWENTPSDNDEGFGYAPRYAEYKFGLGQVHGDFRSSLRDFHDARFFDSAPSLNQEFIEVSTVNDGDSGLNRIFAVTDSSMADHLWVSMYNDIRVRRVLPKYGTPI